MYALVGLSFSSQNTMGVGANCRGWLVGPASDEIYEQIL